MTSHYRGRRDFRTPRSVLLMVVAAELIFLAGCPTAIHLAAGRWVNLPGVGESLGNSIRAWLRALPLLLLACVPGRARAAPELQDPHHHVVPVHAAPWENELAPDARMVRLKARVSGVDSVLSPGRRWRAFVVESDEEPGGRVWVEAVRGGARYELREIPLPYRPISDLVWLDRDHLAFDRWSQPHHGVHYVLDVKRRRLVLSAEFPDEFALRPQAPERR